MIVSGVKYSHLSIAVFSEYGESVQFADAHRPGANLPPMRLTIGRRLFASLLLVSLFLLVLMAVVTRWSFEQGFLEYVTGLEAERLATITPALALWYEREGSFEGLAGNPMRWMELYRDAGRRRIFREMSPPDRRPPDGQRLKPPPLPPEIVDMQRRIAVADASGDTIVGSTTRETASTILPIESHGEVVGYLYVAAPTRVTEQADLAFASRQQRATLAIGGVMLLLAAIVAALVSGTLTRPIRRLAAATHVLSSGDLEQRIASERSDELGDLARDLDRLAEILEDNRRARRQWVGDIAHELRTPVAILSGELAALSDGVRPFDRASLESLEAETRRLETLIGDLHELTVSDNGGLSFERSRVDLAGLCRDYFAAVKPRAMDAGIDLRLILPDAPLFVSADSERLEQVFGNLVENTLRYTDAPGTLEVSLDDIDDHAEIRFSDSAPGVPDDALPRLFDRLYRVDASRNRASGGSGLGLAITEAIVRAHDGSIRAERSPLGGVSIVVRLPVSADQGSSE